MSEPLSHVERAFCAHIASGRTTAEAAKRVSIPLRTAERLRARDDAKVLIEEKRRTGITWHDALSLDLYSPVALDRRRAAVELGRFERSADAAQPAPSAGAVSFPIEFYDWPEHRTLAVSGGSDADRDRAREALLALGYCPVSSPFSADPDAPLAPDGSGARALALEALRDAG